MYAILLSLQVAAHSAAFACRRFSLQIGLKFDIDAVFAMAVSLPATNISLPTYSTFRLNVNTYDSRGNDPTLSFVPTLRNISASRRAHGNLLTPACSSRLSTH